MKQFQTTDPLNKEDLFKVIKLWNKYLIDKNFNLSELHYIKPDDFSDFNDDKEYDLRSDERLNFYLFYELYNDMACEDWSIIQKDGKIYGGYWDIDKNTASHKTRYDNGKILFALDYPHPVILWCMNYLCHFRAESCVNIERLCKWIKGKMDVLTLQDLIDNTEILINDKESSKLVVKDKSKEFLEYGKEMEKKMIENYNEIMRKIKIECVDYNPNQIHFGSTYQYSKKDKDYVIRQGVNKDIVDGLKSKGGRFIKKDEIKDVVSNLKGLGMSVKDMQNIHLLDNGDVLMDSDSDDDKKNDDIFNSHPYGLDIPQFKDKAEFNRIMGKLQAFQSSYNDEGPVFRYEPFFSPKINFFEPGESPYASVARLFAEESKNAEENNLDNDDVPPLDDIPHLVDDNDLPPLDDLDRTIMEEVD
jgi:hypothetical protein